ncbi:hypothetical protein C8Q74DRAFT_1253373 [Fomes fomentarius]|nr:hypothetical protein C8Q74DRAFT_1253373 [Fomes fomentarius]
MAANTASAFARKASNLASSAFTTALVPGSSTSSTKGPFPPNHRPNKLELEAHLFHAHIRARQRKLRESLGLGVPATTTQRKVRASAATFVPREVHVHAATPTIPSCYDTSTTPSTTPSSSRPSTPDSAATPEPLTAASVDHQPWRKTVEAPSPSMLPTPDFSRPRFPHRRSRFSPARKASQGTVGLGLFTLEEDAVVSPSPRQLNADSFRRTPGAPQGSKALTQSSESGHDGSYFHLPSNLLTPMNPLPVQVGASVGLGPMAAEQYFPVV